MAPRDNGSGNSLECFQSTSSFSFYGLHFGNDPETIATSSRCGCKSHASFQLVEISWGSILEDVEIFENTPEVHTTVESWVMLRDTVRVMRLYDVAKPDRLATRGNDKKDNYSTGLTRNTSC
jgi:hypothetical protein